MYGVGLGCIVSCINYVCYLEYSFLGLLECLDARTIIPILKVT